MMGEVEHLIRLNEVWAGVGVISDGALVPKSCIKVISEPAGARPNTFGERNKYLQQKVCDSELPPQKSWLNNWEE